MTYHVPARVWTLAKLAAKHGWEITFEPSMTQCDVTFYRQDEFLSIGWLITGGRARLVHVGYEATGIRLRDVPAILAGDRR